MSVLGTTKSATPHVDTCIQSCPLSFSEISFFPGSYPYTQAHQPHGIFNNISSPTTSRKPTLISCWSSSPSSYVSGIPGRALSKSRASAQNKPRTVSSTVVNQVLNLKIAPFFSFFFASLPCRDQCVTDVSKYIYLKKMLIKGHIYLT